MKYTKHYLILFVFLLLGIVASGQVTPNFTIISYPGAVATTAYAINNNGTVTGWWDDGSTTHGFVRSSGGSYTSFDAPDATGGTQVFGINSNGDVAGEYYTSGNVQHGFFRTAAGTLTEFDPSGSTSTFVVDIDDSGTVAGYYINGSSIGFIRASNGTITTFNPPDEVHGTTVKCINNGMVVGLYIDASYAWNGYIRAADGTFTEFSVPGSASGTTQPLSVNASGTVAGAYGKPSDINTYGFIRTSAGVYTTFSFPIYASTDFVMPITTDGTTIATSSHINSPQYGEIRYSNGVMVYFLGPTGGTVSLYGINDSHVIVGVYVSSGHGVGFTATISSFMLSAGPF